MTAVEAVRATARELEAAGVPSPRVDAVHLVARALELTRTEVYARDPELDESQAGRLRSLVDRRRSREPLAYILGEWGFRRLELVVDPRVLVPRPETEVVVERCLAHLRGIAGPRVLDVGTGSGAIALAIADEHPGALVTATDRSTDALEVARENLGRTALNGRVELVKGDLFAGLEGPFDLVVSNPPYVAPDEFDSLDPEIRLYEPRDALVGEGVTSAIAAGARRVLRPGGWLVLECGDEQAGAVGAEFRSLGYRDVAATNDLAGRERVVEGRRP